jgi:4'-phosphopantetheinyl transferase
MGEVPSSSSWLSPAESSRLAALRFPKRRTEVRLSRWTAKHAIAAALGLDTEPASLAGIELRPAPTGAPRAYVGDEPAPVSVSLTDRADWAVCVVGPPELAIGCDLELVEPRTDAFIRDWFTLRERDAVPRAGEDRHLMANLLWSAKESALKVLQTGLRRDTRSVEVNILDPAGHAHWTRLVVRAEEGPVFPGWWHRYHDFLLTVAADGEHAAPVCLEEPRLAAATPAHSWLNQR